MSVRPYLEVFQRAVHQLSYLVRWVLTVLDAAIKCYTVECNRISKTTDCELLVSRLACQVHSGALKERVLVWRPSTACVTDC
jgi:hypothetical protein